MSELGDAADFVLKNHPLPRCLHGNAMRDHGGQELEPPCGCKLAELILDAVFKDLE